MKSHPSYELIGAVGQGRRATVYRARDLALKREVAIKELNDEALRDEALLQRFWEEARLLANVEHDNLVQIYGLDQERGWVIMELADSSLAASLAGGPLPADWVRSVLRQVLEGLDCLHHQGRIHGAIKPANLLLTSQGIVKLSDTAGVAGGPAADAPPKYLAPEQLDPSFGPVGTGVDLYCLGFTALELLTGSDFDALFPVVEAGADGWRLLHGSAMPLPAAAAVILGLPPDVARVIDRLLQKNVADRYASAADALKDLDDMPAAPLAAWSSVRTVAPVQAIPIAPANPPTVRVPNAARAARPDAPARETLQPTMFPVLQSPSGRNTPFPPVAVAPGPNPAKGQPALQTVRDTLKYPRWSRRWINQKLENPRVLYPVCGTIAFVTVLLLANLLFNRFGSGPTPAPGPGPTPIPEPTPAVTSTVTLRPVKIMSFPTGASIFIDGEPIQEKTNAILKLKTGQHKIHVELKGFVNANQSIDVPADGPEVNPVDFSLIEVRSNLVPTPTSKPREPPPPPGRLQVRSHPDTATVFVDDKERGQTPLEIELPPGKYRVRLKHALYKPRQQEVEIRAGEPLSIDQPLEPLRAFGSFALLVGVHEVDGLPVFRHAPADMAELGRTLLAAGYSKRNVTVLAQSLNANPESLPTAERIQETVSALVKDRYPGDTLLLALAGPIIVRPGDTASYFCPAGADMAKPATLVSLAEIFQQLAACPAQTKVVLIDGNRIGPTFPARPTAAKPEDLVPPGVTVLLATTNGEPGYVHARARHGVFWHFVLRGLRGAAGGGDTVTVGMLAEYVRERTRQYSDRFYKMEQTPKLLSSSARALAAPLAAPEPALRLLLEGDALQEKEEFEKAAEKYGLAIASRKEVEAYLGRAEACFPLRRYGEMIDDCTEALRLDPGNAAASDLLGDAHRGKSGKLTDMKLNEMQVALQCYDAAILSDPDYAPFYQSRGVARGSIALVYGRNKEMDKAKAEDQLAIADFCQAINRSPRPHSRYFEARARAYKRLGEYDRAADDYTAALQSGERLPPDDLFLLYYNRGQVYIENKDFKRAEADFAKAATLNRDDPDPHKWRARALDGLGRTDDAKEARAKETELRKRQPGSSK
jgi:serine/threonine protein kinase/tetratricopeptide (TPR) repeat protein